MKRTASAIWKGKGKDGKGTLSTQSGILKDANYSYKTRFEEGQGTNPEELIAAAHSGCFTMKLSFNLSEADYKTEKLETSCEITLEKGKITHSKLTLDAKVPEIEQDEFDKLVKDAKENCTISMLLDTEISVSATLNK